MSLALTELRIPGCFELKYEPRIDDRGTFLKTFQTDMFGELGLESEFVEVFFTVSHANVLRGMHCQLPPSDHAKLVYCLSGRVQDVLVDLRRGSPTYGEFATLRLDAAAWNAVYVPRGVAHGFYVEQAPATMVYHVTSKHEPALDSGVAWNSFGAPWTANSPKISVRDGQLPQLDDFDSPFLYSPGRPLTT